MIDAYTMKDGMPIQGNPDYDNVLFWMNRDPRFEATIAWNGDTWKLSGNSKRRQWTYIKAIADNIEEIVYKECDERPYHMEQGDQWTLVDYVNVVVHIFQHEQRKFYDLESLWEDAERMEHKD